MDHISNTIQNNALAALTRKAPAGVAGAIQQASAKTGVDFAYLVQQAGAESSFNPAAKAGSSSASGLYQFIESTWMSMVEKYGEKHGIETEGKSKKEILALRNDPEASSLMAAEFASENKKFLNDHWGGKIGSTELYFAHFLGAGQAASFLSARDENPLGEAAIQFPQAAKANRNVFYDTATGRPKTLDEVYAFFDRKFVIEGSDAIVDPKVAEQIPASSESMEIISLESKIPASVVRTGGRGSLFAAARDSGITPFYKAGYSPPGYQNLLANPLELLLLSRMELPLAGRRPI